MKRSETPVTFTDEDLAKFGITRAEITSHPEHLSCLAYAFLRLGETGAKELIFKKGAEDAYLTNLFDILQKWNYSPVSNPAPGDLVVYLTGDKPEHSGVIIGDDLVDSKIGICNSFSHTHRIFDTESRALFFRKTR